MSDSPRHVVEIGRWRVYWRLDRYRSGVHFKSWERWSFALPFLWVNVLRRNPMFVTDWEPKERRE